VLVSYKRHSGVAVTRAIGFANLGEALHVTGSQYSHIRMSASFRRSGIATVRSSKHGEAVLEIDLAMLDGQFVRWLFEERLFYELD
jgi:hypothetical protein